MQLLIVEDDTDIRESLGELLTAEGFQVTLAENGRAALDVLEASTTLPRVILLDLMMPVMSGEQFRQAQLADARYAGIPIVVMSAARDVRETGERLGAAVTLKKPLGIDALVLALRAVAGG